MNKKVEDSLDMTVSFASNKSRHRREINSIHETVHKYPLSDAPTTDVYLRLPLHSPSSAGTEWCGPSTISLNWGSSTCRKGCTQQQQPLQSPVVMVCISRFVLPFKSSTCAKDLDRRALTKTKTMRSWIQMVLDFDIVVECVPERNDRNNAGPAPRINPWESSWILLL